MARPIKTIKIVKKCDCCGKEKLIYPSEVTGKIFFTCSKECRYVMVGRNNKRIWANLTPEQRKDCILKLNHNPNNGKGFSSYWETHNIKMLNHTVTAIKNHNGMIGVQDRINLKISQSPCVLLKAHAILLKDDPERLTTAFCQTLMGIKCKNYDKDETNLQQTEPEENASD